jgi:large subunit ribosomal protein L35
MPKLKTNSGAKKRLKHAGGNRFLRKRTHRRHLLTKKSANRKRKLRAGHGNIIVKKCDERSVRRLIGW